MKSKNKKKSIFDINYLMTQNSTSNILENIELVSENVANTGHVLSKNIEFDGICTSKNDMLELIKTGYNLPEADTPENMLMAPPEEKKEKPVKEDSKNDSFKMINLVSKSYNLPEIDNDLLK